MRISDWSSDVCSSDLSRRHLGLRGEMDGVEGRVAGVLSNRRSPSSSPPRKRGPISHRGRAWNGREMGSRFRGNDVIFTERSEEHTSELQSLMRISYAVFCLKKKKKNKKPTLTRTHT